jgi:hypothetical protein
MPKGASTTNEQKRKARKVKARERAVKRAHNIWTRNTSDKAKLERSAS